MIVCVRGKATCFGGLTKGVRGVADLSARRIGLGRQVTQRVITIGQAEGLTVECQGFNCGLILTVVRVSPVGQAVQLR